MRTPCLIAHLRSLLITALISLSWYGASHATGLFSSVDTEKPNPEFSRSDDRITARFIPRAKSSRVSVEFQITDGGTIDQVKGIDFFTIDRPDVDIKNFKSAAFEIGIRNVTPGGTATVAIRSDFFSLSTAYFVFNPNLAEPWIRDAQTENRLLAGRVREIIIQVQDGGDRDADGAADGRIRLVGGPRDSFWGYALGTLFIRFFGIFFVLSLLMIGMFVSGWVFKRLDRLKASRPAGPEKQSGPAASRPAIPTPQAAQRPLAPVAHEVVAAIGAALYLRDPVTRTVTSSAMPGDAGAAWTLEGRRRIMRERLAVFQHAGKHSG